MKKREKKIIEIAAEIDRFLTGGIEIHPNSPIHRKLTQALRQPDVSDSNQFNIGDKVVKNEKTWEPNDFDSWGRGIGVGIIVEPPFEMDEGEVDVKWPNGRCFEFTRQLNKKNG